MSYYHSLDVHTIMNWISTVEKDHLYFSGYPTDHFLKILKQLGFTHIINLTSLQDNLPEYKTDLIVRSFPILDHQVPEDIFSFIEFLQQVRMDYYHNGKILVHCKAGKGRSSLFCISLLVMLGYGYLDAFRIVSESYNSRLIRMETMQVSPLRLRQHAFLQKITREIYIDLEGPNTFYGWLSLQDDPEFYKYLMGQLNTSSPSTLYTILYTYLYNKFVHNKELFLKLKFTYLKRIVLLPECVGYMKFIGNMYIKILHRLRELNKKL